ncbi:bifunctional DNA-formamidopyrimidine glycosylase/DNA-(apurinic or apyrimidinic site) lyase [Neptunomonas qingdaonensis]|uniref:Formamidopyrimidine-DNA glycosylase n=1 Tax=Neptunomonas qingdaonensis TaxID=1045558 RepID=A0A1I2WGQ8_9GAMM|nr:bifunctional DNA-formamidopyrimidine glycosylase/DNA-(apurinic or apyrimidinic site) lyase [Neptunomonas qingdaonensis]SFG99496.1 DNA-(apurinic or apyrimidinic site) lyase [Neptunomonas qingdaonensis]
MPELPEVETTRRGIEPHVLNQCIESVVVRQAKLRWPVPVTELEALVGQGVQRVARRGKYILLETVPGTILIHLGMSGSLRIVTDARPPLKHDHLDIHFNNEKLLRLTDPRRFGAVLWQPQGQLHERLSTLGPEPLSEQFCVAYLQQQCKGRTVTIKQLIMNSRVVVGVGNIYASEALFQSGIDPRKEAGRLSEKRLALLVTEIKSVLLAAIGQGGTTLKDFVNSDGKPGYFQQSLNVYGRGGLPCQNCSRPLKEVRLGQRSTVFCNYCQR